MDNTAGREKELSSVTRVVCYIGIGSNRDQPMQQVERAIERLRRGEIGVLVALSPLYRSAPMGPQDQADYINAVAAIETELKPLELLEALQSIEAEQGRNRSKERRWGARTLDLDILLYGDECIDYDRLIVPHIGLTERAFVLYPLADIAPQLHLPDGRPLAALLRAVPADGLSKL